MEFVQRLIPAPCADKVLSRVHKLQKRANKLGLPTIEVSCEDTDEFVYLMFDAEIGYWSQTTKPTRNDHNYTGQTLPLKKITITGTAPVLNGWSFVAKLSPTVDYSANLINIAPGCKIDQSQLAKYHASEYVGICEHCKTKRRRNDNFLLRHTDGTFKVVGRNCLVDFLGGETPEKILDWCAVYFEISSASATDEVDLIGMYDNQNIVCVDLDIVMAMIHAVIKRDGVFISKSKADEMCIPSTCHLVVDQIFSRSKPCIPGNERIVLADEDFVKAEEVTELLKTFQGVSTFASNLRVLANQKAVSVRSIGYLSAGYSIALQQRAGHSGGQKQSEYMGVKGQKIQTEATLLRVQYLNNSIYPKVLHVFRTDEGNLLVWFASDGGTSVLNQVEVRNRFRVSGTVKDHNAHNDMKQTVLTRCSVEKV